MSTKLVVPYDPNAFPSVAFKDQFGETVTVSSDAEHEGLVCVEISGEDKDGDIGSLPAYLNRSQAVVMRTALELWLQYLDGGEEDDDDDD